jgi:hypothetical protein
MQLKWNKCSGSVWCSLNTVNIDHAHFNMMYGVYVIWHGGSRPATVLVGNGFVREGIRRERQDSRVQAFAGRGLFVTWAYVPEESREGVGRYLTSVLSPLVPSPPSPSAPVQVNTPW